MTIRLTAYVDGKQSFTKQVADEFEVERACADLRSWALRHRKSVRVSAINPETGEYVCRKP